MLTRDVDNIIITILSICLSVCLYCIETASIIIKLSSAHVSPVIPVFLVLVLKRLRNSDGFTLWGLNTRMVYKCWRLFVKSAATKGVPREKVFLCNYPALKLMLPVALYLMLYMLPLPLTSPLKFTFVTLCTTLSAIALRHVACSKIACHTPWDIAVWY